MPLTPQDIQNREFREAFRGYNEDDVDTFLDEVAEEFGRLYMETQRLRVQLSSVPEGGRVTAVQAPPSAAPVAPPPVAATAAVEPAPPPRPEARERSEAREEMKRALVATQRAAEAALEEAKRRAAEIVARAEQRAKEIDDLTARRAKDIDSDASTALTYAQQRVEELRRQEAEIRARLRRMLAEHIKALQHLESEATPAAAAASTTRQSSAPTGSPRTDTPPPVTPKSPQARAAKANGAAKVAGNGPGSAAPAPEGRSPVVDRMARDLGEAATGPGPSTPASDDAFWRR